MGYTKYGPFTNGGAPGLQDTFFNVLENYLHQVPTATETGKYALAGPVYANGALLSIYRSTISQGAVIASLSVDTLDLAPTGGVSGSPTSNFLSASGFQLYSLSTTGPNVNARMAGNWTATF